jgi:hypothetical protein
MMTLTRLAAVVLGLSVWCGGGLSAQQPDQSALRASIEREAANLALTPVAQSPPVDDAATLYQGATGTGQSHDWNAVRHLSQSTRVVVTTSQNQVVRGRISAIGEGTLRMDDRQGDDRILRREDVLEVHLDHRFSTVQYVGLGLLLGGATGLALGHASECDDCELRGLGTVMGGFRGALMGVFVGWSIGGGLNAQPGQLIYRDQSPKTSVVPSTPPAF